jgi:hypothetical protein
MAHLGNFAGANDAYAQFGRAHLDTKPKGGWKWWLYLCMCFVVIMC